MKVASEEIKSGVCSPAFSALQTSSCVLQMSFRGNREEAVVLMKSFHKLEGH